MHRCHKLHRYPHYISWDNRTQMAEGDLLQLLCVEYAISYSYLCCICMSRDGATYKWYFKISFTVFSTTKEVCKELGFVVVCCSCSVFCCDLLPFIYIYIVLDFFLRWGYRFLGILVHILLTTFHVWPPPLPHVLTPSHHQHQHQHQIWMQKWINQ